MFNTEKMNQLVREVEWAQRSFSKASAEKKRVLSLVGEAILKGESDLEQFREELSEAESTMTFCKESLENTKTQMIALVNSIQMWEE
jgi:seryl-tRNA synthetase